MGLKGKLIGEFEVSSSAEEFHRQVRHQPHDIATFSDIVHGCDLHSGDYGDHGSTIYWRYTQLDGKVCSAKELVEVIEENKKIKFTVTEGDMLENYSSLVITLETIAREGDLDLVRWTIDYEKLLEDGPHPVETLDVLLNVGRHIEAEHAKLN